MDRIVFSADALPRHQRFSVYCEEILRPSCGLELRTVDQSSFRARLEFRRVGMIDIMTNTLSAIDTARTATLVRDGDDALLVMLLLNGQAHQTQFGDDHELHAGDAIICDSAYPGEFNLVTSSKLLSLKVPRMKLGALLPHLPRFAGVTLGRDPVPLRLLSGYLAGTFDVDFGDSAEAARLHQDHIVDLVALALGAEGDTRAMAEQRGAQAVRRAAIVTPSRRRWPTRRLMQQGSQPGLELPFATSTICWSQPAGPFPASARQATGARRRAVVRGRAGTPQDCRHRLRGRLQGSLLFQSDVSTEIGGTPSDMRLAAGAMRERS